MCPLRFILVFLSATLAGYFAWKTVRSSSDDDDDDDSLMPKTPKAKQDFSFRQAVQDGFAVFVDMASGRYLWRNFKAMNGNEKTN